MSLCNHCQDLNIPSYRTVAQSRPPEREVDTSRAHAPNGPLGLQPWINIGIDAILSGTSEAQCDTRIMLRNALLAMYSGVLDDLKEIKCQTNISNTLNVTVVRRSGVEEHFEFYSFPGRYNIIPVFVKLEEDKQLILNNKYIWLIQLTDSPPKWPIIGAGRPLKSDSSSDECIELAASWIRDCTENHKDCLRLDQTPLPTRVIAVGSDLEEPYLCASKRGNANYIALSHCWGGIVPMTTTLETLEQRQRQIQFSELPKTFQDAVTITRKLKVPYI